MANIQPHMAQRAMLYFGVNSTGHYIAGGELCALIQRQHKTLSIFIEQMAAFTANRFANQERRAFRIKEAGRVKLLKLKVHQASA